MNCGPSVLLLEMWSALKFLLLPGAGPEWNQHTRGWARCSHLALLLASLPCPHCSCSHGLRLGGPGMPALP